MGILYNLMNFFQGGRTSRTFEDADPRMWREHLFGLTPERWKRLDGRAFWITGAGTGYGRSVACALAAAGAQVFLTGRRVEKLKETIDEASSLFGVDTAKCHVIPADITRREDICSAVIEIKRLCPSLYGLVHSAALPSWPGSRYPLEDDSEQYWEAMMDTNVKAPWLITKTVFPHMQTEREARVLFVTSEAGWADTVGFGMYNVSKAALNSLGQSMAREYASRYPDTDVQMNIVSPGEARTEMNQGTDVSPYSVVSIVLLLLSHPPSGPNGRFFCRDGRHLKFCYNWPYKKRLI